MHKNGLFCDIWELGFCTNSNAFYKICEGCIPNSLAPFVDKFFFFLTSVYRKAYSANDIFIRFIENWKQSLDNHKYVGIPKPIVY